MVAGQCDSALTSTSHPRQSHDQHQRVLFPARARTQRGRGDPLRVLEKHLQRRYGWHIQELLKERKIHTAAILMSQQLNKAQISGETPRVSRRILSV